MHIVGFDNATGNASGLVSTSAPAETGNFVARALQHLQTVGSALGLAPAQPNEFAPDPQTQTTSSGAVVVHLQQSYKSIPIFQADQAVTFTPLGAIDQTNGTAVTIPSDVAATPTIAVGAAAKIAAQFLARPQPEDAGQKDSFGQPAPAVAIDSSSWQPRVIAVFGAKADAPTVLEGGPFGDVIKALLVWFFSTEPRLAWHFVFVMPAYQGQYRVIVDAQNGEILYSHQLMRGVTAAGNVFQRDGSTARIRTSFPRPALDYGLPAVSLPSGFPADWVSGNNTNGNTVNAHLNDTGAPLTGAVVSSVLTFDPSDPGSDDQRVLNIFYYSCYMHDYLYLLGFREVDGNFQQNSLGPGGTPGDPLDARAYEGAVWATASMATPVDGTSPVMRMGLVTETSRHTALDSTVVFHEYTHGLTGRLVGGPMNDQALDGAQSAGMSEGWSDYVACTITGANVIAAWVLDTAAGARGFPYDSHFPDTFGNLGTGRYDEPHNIGEIWCAALLAVNDAIGSKLAIQLMVDGLKLTAANPGFLDGRDSMLLALDHMRTAGQISAAQHDSFAASMWQVFARFGMGPNAQSNGASLSGIVGDFHAPQNIAPASAFSRIGSPATGLPASVAVTAVTAESQRLDAFAVVSGGPIYTSSRTAAGGAWVPWTPVGGASSPTPPLSGVTAVSTSAGRIDLFLVAGDGEIQATFRATSGAAWSGWSRIGAATDRAPATSALTAVSSAPGRSDVFLVGSDGGVYTASRATGSGPWSDWSRVGGASDAVPVLSVVTDVSAELGRIDLFVVAMDGGVYTSSRIGNTSAWADWSSVGSLPVPIPLKSTVTPVSSQAARVDLFVVANDGGIYTTSRTAGGAAWAGWSRIGAAGDKAPLKTGIAAVSASAGRIDAFLVAGDGGVYTTSRPSGAASWSDWSRVGTTTDTAPLLRPSAPCRRSPV